MPWISAVGIQEHGGVRSCPRTKRSIARKCRLSIFASPCSRCFVGESVLCQLWLTSIRCLKVATQFMLGNMATTLSRLWRENSSKIRWVVGISNITPWISNSWNHDSLIKGTPSLTKHTYTLIFAIQVGVAVEALILDSGEGLGLWITEGETSSTIRCSICSDRLIQNCFQCSSIDCDRIWWSPTRDYVAQKKCIIISHYKPLDIEEPQF